IAARTVLRNEHGQIKSELPSQIIQPLIDRADLVQLGDVKLRRAKCRVRAARLAVSRLPVGTRLAVSGRCLFLVADADGKFASSRLMRFQEFVELGPVDEPMFLAADINMENGKFAGTVTTVSVGP